MRKPKSNETGKHLSLTSPLARWAVIRAGGWAGPYGEPTGYHIELDVETNAPMQVLDFEYKDTRDPNKACKVLLTDCVKLGCRESGKCNNKRSK